MIDATETEPPDEHPERALFNTAMRHGLGTVADLEQNLQSLDALLLTGRPHAIADAATALELSLSAADPAFQRVAQALTALGAGRLQDAAQQLRPSDQAAAAAESLRTALKRFVKRNDACHRRAQGLGRGLNASLRALHALGMAGNDRLIAEA
jgi:hypothetical protein